MKREFIFNSQGIDKNTGKETWTLYEDVCKPFWSLKLTETIRYDKEYTAEDIIDFIKVFQIDKNVRIKIN